MLTTILFLTCINNTYAACTQEEIDEFKKVEDQYTIKYEFNKDTKDYTLYFSNYDSKKYSYFIETGEKMNCTVLDEVRTKCSGIKPNEYNIEILGITNTCDETLKTFTLNLKEYNNYSEDPLCEGIEEFVLCQPTYDKDIDYETFVSRVNTYKKSKEKKEVNNSTEKKDKNKAIVYIEENIVQIIIVAIFCSVVKSRGNLEVYRGVTPLCGYTSSPAKRSPFPSRGRLDLIRLPLEGRLRRRRW